MFRQTAASSRSSGSRPARCDSPSLWRRMQIRCFDFLPVVNDRESSNAAHAALRWVPVSLPTAGTGPGPDVGSAGVYGLRQPGGDPTTFDENVQRSVPVAVVRDTATLAGPFPDL